jgi:hypothetical protein
MAFAAEPATIALNLAGATAPATPPATFNPLSASDAELLQFGFPHRPDAAVDPAGYQLWAKAMSALKKRIIPELRVKTIQHRPNMPAQAEQPAFAAANTVAQSSNWSGYVDTNTLTKFNAKSSFSTITAEYVVPNVSNASCDNGWDYASEWVGIDGWSNGDVLQAGSDSDAYCSGPLTGVSYYAWFEWFPNYETQITNLPVESGDDMYVEVQATSATTGMVFIENLNLGIGGSINMTAPSGTKLIGSSAEWIVERPGVNGSLATLPNYTADYFSAASALNFANKLFAPGATEIDMVGGAGTVISQPVLLGKNAFQANYQ